MSTKRKQAARDAGSKAKKIASTGENVRERTRRAFADAVSKRQISFDAIADVTGSMVDGAAEAVKSAAPKEKTSVLKEVIDGLADGFSGSANAARTALKEAKGRGQQFVKKDVQRVTDNLRVLEEVFFETVSNGIERAQHQLGGQAHDLQRHAKQAASKMRPALDKALHAAMDHPVELLTETASAGAKAAPRAAGAFLQAMSGLLAGAGDMLADASRDKKKSTKKKTSKKKTAKKKAAKKKTGKKKSTKKKAAKKAAQKKSARKKTTKKKPTKKKSAKRAAKR